MEFQGLAQGSHRTLRYRASVVVLVMGSVAGISAPGFAREDSYKMPQEICDILREEPVNQSLLKQIGRRPDFVDLLDYADTNCGGVAGLLIGATGSIPVLVAEQDGVLPQVVAGPGTGTGGTPDNGGPISGGDTGTGGTGTGGTGTDGTGTGGSGSGGSGAGGSGAVDSNGHGSGDSTGDGNGHESGDSGSDGSNDDDDSGNGSSSSDSHMSGY